jgi:hypothetical protein
MTALIKGKLTCVSHSATNFPEPNTTREELDAAAVRLNLLAEAEMYSTDAVMTMVEADESCTRPVNELNLPPNFPRVFSCE